MSAGLWLEEIDGHDDGEAEKWADRNLTIRNLLDENTPDLRVAEKLGMIWAGSHHIAELYHPNCKLLHCRKCQHYGHIETRCHAPTKCFKRACSHTADMWRRSPMLPRSREKTRSQGSIKPGESGKFCCAICQGSHASYNEDCSVRMRAIEAIELAKKCRPAFFTAHPVKA